MNIACLVLWLVIGAVAGWLAGQIMKGGRFGLVGNIVVGIIGSVIGGFLLGGVLASLGILGSVVTAVIGTPILLFVVGFFIRRQDRDLSTGGWLSGRGNWHNSPIAELAAIVQKAFRTARPTATDKAMPTASAAISMEAM